MIEIIIKILLFSYTITRFEPLEWVLELLPDKLLFNILKYILSCSRCLSFWFGWFYSGSFWIAAISSILMVIIEKTFGKWERTIEF